MRPTGPLVAALALLCACGPRQQEQAAAPAAPAAPAQAPAAAADFGRDINLLGNEPFWALQIRKDELTFSAPERDELKADNPGPKVTGDQAEWMADASGQPLKVMLTVQACQDAMSGLFYPFKAVVEVEGVMLEGCGAYADAMPRERS